MGKLQEEMVQEEFFLVYCKKIDLQFNHKEQVLIHLSSECQTICFCAELSQEIIGDACKEDSGGPLVRFLDDTWYLIEMVSCGNRCATPGKYGFYTQVYNYHDWIRSSVK